MIDQIDKEILEILESNARLSPEAICSIMNNKITPQEVKNRIEKLEKDGIIIHYKTLIDWEKVGEEKLYAFIEVKITPERNYGFDAVAKKIYNFPEVHSVYLVSGTYDLIVVVGGKNIKDIALFVAEKLAPIERVQSTVTHFILKKYKMDGRIIQQEVDKRLLINP